MNMLNSSLESKRQNPAENAREREIRSRFAFKRLLNYIWDKELIAKQSRKQNLLEVCKNYLTNVESQILSSDQDNLKGIALHKEKYLLIQEKMKLILHYFEHHVKLNMMPEDFLKLREQLISRGLELSSNEVLEKMRKAEEDATLNGEGNELSRDKDKVYNEIWESEILRLRGKIFMEAKDYNAANE